MYVVATRQMETAPALPFLDLLSPGVFAVALAAWVLAFIGLLRELRKIVQVRLT
jgi:hypothetical protein